MPQGFRSSSYIRTILPLTHSVASDCIFTLFIDHRNELSAIDAFMQKIGIDSVYVQRDCLDRSTAEWITEFCRRNSVTLFLELDDDLFDLPESHVERNMKQPRNHALRHLCQEAQTIFVSTDRLKYRLARFSRNVSSHPNFLDEGIWFGPLPMTERGRLAYSSGKIKRGIRVRRCINILYMGTYTHAQDLELVIPALREAARLLKHSRGVRLRVYLIGISTNNTNLGLPFIKVPVPPEVSRYPDFVPWLRSNNIWDIGIAPLVDTAFNQAKSDLKLLEYAVLGLPGIYSPVGGCAESVSHGKNGLICRSNESKEWTEHVLTLSCDPDLRSKLAAGAHEWVCMNRLAGQNVAALCHEFLLTIPEKPQECNGSCRNLMYPNYQ